VRPPAEPPAAQHLEAEAEPQDLASLNQRWKAAVIDLAIPIALIWAGIRIGGVHLDVWSHGSQNPIDFFVSLFSIVVSAGVALLPYLIVTTIYTARSSQSIGKRLVGIRIDRVEGGRASSSKIALRNYAVAIGALAVSFLLGTVYSGGFLQYTYIVWLLVIAVDVAPIFGEARRCIHDYVAGTVVVVAPDLRTS
jgi:uncharacterized RDD family membrane protein YckC